MKKLIKDWWPLLLLAGLWIWKKTRRNSGNGAAPSSGSGEAQEVEIPTLQVDSPFQGGECVYGPPTIYQ